MIKLLRENHSLSITETLQNRLRGLLAMADGVPGYDKRARNILKKYGIKVAADRAAITDFVSDEATLKAIKDFEDLLVEF